MCTQNCVWIAAESEWRAPICPLAVRPFVWVGDVTRYCWPGGANSGHYHAIIKDLHGQGVWEAAVARAQEAGAASAWGGAGAAGGGGGDGASKSAWGKMGAKIASGGGGGVGVEYVVEEYAERPELLIRDIVTQFESMGGTNVKGMSLKTLDSEMTEQTGRAWAERYKSLHGTIREFAESKPHLFDVKDFVVSVVEGANFDDHPPQAPASVHPPSTAAPVTSAWGAAEAGGGERPASWAKVAAKPTPVDCTEKCWFDFNDMTISPVSVKELDKYYEGSECAYVLFYRRKVAAALPSVPRAVVPGLPSHMEEEITHFNNTVKSSRSNYKEKMSQVTIKCYPASSLEFDGVSLRPVHNIDRHFKVEIDRRWNLAQTKAHFFDNLSQQPGYSNCPELSAGRGAVELHLLRQCVAPSFTGGNDGGMHVYELLGSEHEESRGLGTRVKDDMMILLWDGRGGNLGWPEKLFNVGPETEALALSVSFLKPPSSTPRDTPAAPSTSFEAKGVWGGGGASAVGVVSGAVGGIGEEEADGPPPEGVRRLVRKDWTLGHLRELLGQELRAMADSEQDAGMHNAQAVIHRLDRKHSLGGSQPLCLDSADDTKTLGELQLKEARGCWLCVEFALSAVWQEPRAFKAFKWTYDGRTRVYVELPVSDSSKLSAHVDVSWDLPVSEVKKKANAQLREQIKALPPAEKALVASMNESKVGVGGAKGPRKEWRLVLQGGGWSEQGFSVTDETMTLRDIYLVHAHK